MAAKREGRFLITLGETTLKQLDEVCEQMGVPRATYCAVLIADGLRNRRQADLFISKLPDMVSSAMKNPEVVKELSQKSDD